jgi:hypothetical protein
MGDEDVKKEEKKVVGAMDYDRIAMICTESEKVGAYLQYDIHDKKTFGEEIIQDIKEPPTTSLGENRQKANYPLQYLLNFLQLAKKMKAKYITIELAENKPLKAIFNDENGKETRFYVAPRID